MQWDRDVFGKAFVSAVGTSGYGEQAFHYIQKDDDQFLLMSSPRRDDERQKARIAKVEDKWNVLFNQKTRAPIYNVHQYIDYLRKYTGNKDSMCPTVGEGTDPHTSGDVHPVSYLLQKLKLDLKMSYQWFIEDFVRKPNNGLALLIVLLKNIQKAAKEVSSVPSKARVQNKKRLLFEEHDCLICIKFCLRTFEAGVILLDASYGLESIGSALMSSHTKSRIVALEVMSLILREPDGFQRNLDCFTYFRLKNGEPARFKFLISMLMSRNTTSLAFQICCMRFLNSLLTTSPSSNTRVFLQGELELAGMDTNVLLLMIEDLNLPDKGTLMKEILDYRNSAIDIDYLIEKQKFLQEQISRLKLEINGVRLENERAKSPKKRHAPLPPPTPTNVLASQLAQNAEEIATEVANYTERTAQQNFTSPESVTVDIPQSTSENKLSAIVPRRNMPFLNWIPLVNIEDTVFKTLNYERILDEIELFDLEERFKIGKDTPKVVVDNDYNVSSIKCKDQRIRFMDPARAKNLSILQKRIGRHPERIKQFISEYDVDALLSDNAELLLKFIPTEEEMRTIMTLDFEFEDLGEAEQMLLQLMSIERLEDKLKLMLFMDQFSKTCDSLTKPIEEIRVASLAVSNCVKIRKIFEIILAVGNFINGNRKGQTNGFRLTSLPVLEDLRSSDKTRSLVDYITEVVECHYFEVHDWYTDLDIVIPFKASYHSISASVKDLREGMKILKQESSQCSSPRLVQFQTEAVDTMASLESSFHDMQIAYENVCTLFGEHSLSMDSTDFFKIIFNFADSYKKADTQLARKRWRRGISHHINTTRFPLSPTKESKWTTNTVPESKGMNFNVNECPTSVPSATIPSMYGKDHEEILCSYDPYEVTQNKDHTSLRDHNANSCVDNDHEVKQLPDLNANTCTYDPYGIKISNENMSRQEPTIENWIVSSPPPDKCSDVLKEECHAKMLQLEGISRDNEIMFDCDTESNDSAFVGSEGQFLKSSCSKSNEYTLKYGKHSDQKTSTPFTRNTPPPEPLPDYSVPDSDNEDMIDKQADIDAEISKVLSEFEGDLNGYCSRTVTPSPRRFVTIRSIIYI